MRRGKMMRGKRRTRRRRIRTLHQTSRVSL